MTVPVVILPAPFAAEPVYLDRPSGLTVKALLVEAVDTGVLSADLLAYTTVYVDGRALSRDTALDHVLDEGQVVNVVVEPQGGGGGRKDIGQVLMTVAVVAVSAWVGGGAGGLIASRMLAQVAGAAVLTLGQAASAALFAPAAQAQARANDRYALQAAANQYRPWGPFPLALGEVHVAPDLAVKTFTRAIGDDVWLYGILALHYGPCTVADLKIGDTTIASMGSGDVQVVDHLTPGPRTFALYPNDTDQRDFQEALEKDGTALVRAGSNEGELFEFDFFLPGGLHFQKDDGRVVSASVTVAVRYRPIDEDGVPTGAGTWTAGTTLPLTSTTKDPWRVMASLPLTMGRYEFEFRRSLPDDANPKRADDIGLTAIRSIAFRKPVVDETLSLIEFAVRATALNQGTLAPWTCRITPIAQTWDAGAGAWSAPVPTSNPAAVTRWLMTGPAPAKPLSSDEADTGLRTWSVLCDTYDWTANLYLTDERRQSEVLALLEQAGRASMFFDGSTLVASCWVEKPVPVQLFTGSNLRDHRWSIVYPEPVHALRVEFQNLDRAGEPDELFVYADGYAATAGPGVSAATLIESLRLEGQKTPGRAWRDGRWELGRRIHQRRIDTWTVDAEHLVSRYGQRVRLSWQKMEGGRSARVRCRRWSGGLVSGLRLDQSMPFAPGELYALDLRMAHELATEVPIRNPAVVGPVNAREITFDTPRPPDQAPVAGDLVAFGVLDRISEDVEIIGMTPGEDMSCVITGVRYVAPLLMAGETGPIPELPSRLSLQRRQAPSPPQLLGVQVDATGVRVAFALSPWRGSPVTGFTARWRVKPDAGGASGWLDLPDLPATAMLLATPPIRELPTASEEATDVEIEIRTVTASGRVSVPLLVVASQPAPQTPALTGWTVEPRPVDAGGVSQPGLVVTGSVDQPNVASVLIEYGLSPVAIDPEQPLADQIAWVQTYFGPAPTQSIQITGLAPLTAYHVAVTYLTAQGVAPSPRLVLGPVTTGGLHASVGDGARRPTHRNPPYILSSNANTIFVASHDAFMETGEKVTISAGSVSGLASATLYRVFWRETSGFEVETDPDDSHLTGGSWILVGQQYTSDGGGGFPTPPSPGDGTVLQPL